MTLSPEDYVGDSADRTGFSGLEAVDAVTMLAVSHILTTQGLGYSLVVDPQTHRVYVYAITSEPSGARLDIWIPLAAGVARIEES